MLEHNSIKFTATSQKFYNKTKHEKEQEQEVARKYMAKRNLEDETPTKKFCNQIKKFRQREKLTCLLIERKLSRAETPADPIQKQNEEIFSQTKIKNHVKDFYSNLYAKKPTTPNSDEIIKAVGKDNIETLNPQELELTEKEISMS